MFECWKTHSQLFLILHPACEAHCNYALSTAQLEGTSLYSHTWGTSQSFQVMFPQIIVMHAAQSLYSAPDGSFNHMQDVTTLQALKNVLAAGFLHEGVHMLNHVGQFCRLVISMLYP